MHAGTLQGLSREKTPEENAAQEGGDKLYTSHPTNELELPKLSVLVANDHIGYIYSSVCSSSKNLLYCGSGDSLIGEYDVHTMKRKSVFKGHQGSVVCLAFDEASDHLFSGAGDNRVKV